MTETMRPAVPLIQIPDNDPAYLQGYRCTACDETYLEDRRQCSRCFAPTLVATRLSETGRLYNYTIVHRSFPGVEVPFISAIVDLDGGGTIRGNLNGVAKVPEAIAFDMPVRVEFAVAKQADPEGNAYLAYHFIPADEGAAA